MLNIQEISIFLRGVFIVKAYYTKQLHFLYNSSGNLSSGKGPYSP